MNLLEEVDNYQHFDKSKIKNFIDFGNKIIENEEKLESKEFSKLFKKYSRNYMNFIMNHTNFIYLLFVYKNLLESKYNDYIKYIIKINNYVLSIISDTGSGYWINSKNLENITVITRGQDYALEGDTVDIEFKE